MIVVVRRVCTHIIQCCFQVYDSLFDRTFLWLAEIVRLTRAFDVRQSIDT